MLSASGSSFTVQTSAFCHMMHIYLLQFEYTGLFDGDEALFYKYL